MSVLLTAINSPYEISVAIHTISTWYNNILCTLFVRISISYLIDLPSWDLTN